MTTILTISDLHIPFEHPSALEFICRLYDEYQPDHLVNLGDEVDQYCFSLYTKSPEALGTRMELELMHDRLQDWYALFPEMKLCYGNHTTRYLKRAIEAGLPSDVMRTVKEFLNAPPGWEWQDSWRIDGIEFFHGEPYAGRQAPRNMLMDSKHCRVHGHLHSLGGVTWEMTHTGDSIWVASAGCLVNPTEYAFAYTKKNRVRDVLGTIVIVDGVPIFEPLEG